MQCAQRLPWYRCPPVRRAQLVCALLGGWQWTTGLRPDLAVGVRAFHVLFSTASFGHFH